MKTIPVEQLDQRLTKAIEQQDEHEAIGLTNDKGTVAWVVRVPEALKDSTPDAVLFAEGPEGRVLFILEAKHRRQVHPVSWAKVPVFGAGRGTLTIISEDDEHLKDFQEYME